MYRLDKSQKLEPLNLFSLLSLEKTQSSYRYRGMRDWLTDATMEVTRRGRRQCSYPRTAPCCMQKPASASLGSPFRSHPPSLRAQPLFSLMCKGLKLLLVLTPPRTTPQPQELTFLHPSPLTTVTRSPGSSVLCPPLTQLRGLFCLPKHNLNRLTGTRETSALSQTLTAHLLLLTCPQL